MHSSTLFVALGLVTSLDVSSAFVNPARVVAQGSLLQGPSVAAPTTALSVSATPDATTTSTNDDDNEDDDGKQQKPQPKLSRRLKGLYRDASVIFAIIDINGNGLLCRDELTDHMSKAGYKTGVIEKLFAKLDANNDGNLSEQEFQEGFALIPELRNLPGMGNFNSQYEEEIYQDADQTFQSLDANNNGTIDEFELQSYMSKGIFGKYSPEAITKIFNLLDVHNNQKISKNQFRELFLRYSALRQAIGEGPIFK